MNVKNGGVVCQRLTPLELDYIPMPVAATLTGNGSPDSSLTSSSRFEMLQDGAGREIRGGGRAVSMDLAEDETTRGTASDVASRCCAGLAAFCGRARVSAGQFAEEIKAMGKGLDTRAVAKRTFSFRSLKRKLPILQWLPTYRLDLKTYTYNMDNNYVYM